MRSLRALLAFYVPASVLCVWGTVFFHAAWTGRVEQVLHPVFRPWVWAAAGLLLGLAVFYVLALDPPEPERAPAFWRSAGLLVWLIVPLLFSAVLAPTSFSLAAVQARGFSESGVALPDAKVGLTIAPMNTSDPSAPVEVEVLDLLMSAQDPELVKSLEGRAIRVTGQYAPAEKAGGAARVVRMWMQCCAADARPVGVEMDGTAPEVPGMDWVEVTGNLHYVSELGTKRAVVKNAVVQRTASPRESFIY